ncbi:hypothetical protein EDC04DRAFT_3138028 [Pisolithus marmoratus]|nr:hypothetical protein EDC04DRAFT_3138028 [Pisolithus marmoratus]
MCIIYALLGLFNVPQPSPSNAENRVPPTLCIPPFQVTRFSDLSDARAELARLHRRELELLQELLDVRKALAAQKVLIDELVKASTPPPFDRLPNELLVQIFLFVGLHWPCLAYVSRRWNAVIMDTPSIWSEIFLDIYTDSTSLGLHLERSRQAPLTIRLYDYKPELLDVMMVHANRWHTLFILECALPFLRHISHLRFPSLEVLHVNLEPDSVDLLPMMYSRAPALKSLRLEGFAEPLSSFNLTIGLSHKSLTRLLLVGIIDSWEFPRDNIRLPALESLILRIKDPMSLLEAIVAPKLGHFEFSEGYCGDPVCRAFRGPRTKFDSVTTLFSLLCFMGHPAKLRWMWQRNFARCLMAYVIAEIDAEYVIPLFSPCQTVDHTDDLP